MFENLLEATANVIRSVRAVSFVISLSTYLARSSEVIILQLRKLNIPSNTAVSCSPSSRRDGGDVVYRYPYPSDVGKNSHKRFVKRGRKIGLLLSFDLGDSSALQESPKLNNVLTSVNLGCR
jgi:hypothetical protein